MAVCFLWHCPWGCPPWPLASTLPDGARTFLRPAAEPATIRLPLAPVIQRAGTSVATPESILDGPRRGAPDGGRRGYGW
jgi:hypothetical protein